MENQKKNKTYLLITLGVLAAIMITLGITYAYWRLTKEQTNENVVTTACLDVDIESEQADINLPKAYPISDKDAESLVPFKFTIHNKCENNASFQINLESMSKSGDLDIPENQRLNPKYLKFKLNEVEQNGKIGLLTGEKNNDTTKVTPTIVNAYDAHKLMSGYIEPSGSKNFEFRIWMDSETTAEEIESMNKTFVSKISVISTYLEEEKIPPTAELSLSVCENNITASVRGKANGASKWVKKYEYKIDSNEWQDGSEVNEITNQSEGKHTIKARVTDNKGIVSEEVEQEIKIDYVEPTIANLLGQDIFLVKEGSGLYRVSHCGIDRTTNDDGFKQEEYRYAGSNPNNYVEFNDEKWRIIGLLNIGNSSSKIEKRLKIVRIDGIENQQDFGQYRWVNGSEVGSIWTFSEIKEILNGVYYNKTIGTCFRESCDFQSIGLNDAAKQMIDDDVIWNIGACKEKFDEDDYDYNSINASEYYACERGSASGYDYHDPLEISSSIKWKKTDDETYHKGIGLIYPSDYAYSLENNERERCLKADLHKWVNANCTENNWLKPTSNELLTITVNDYDLAVAGEATNFQIKTNGNVKASGSSNSTIWPTLYLKPNVTITGGTGEINSPYQLSIN